MVFYYHYLWHDGMSRVKSPLVMTHSSNRRGAAVAVQQLFLSPLSTLTEMVINTLVSAGGQSSGIPQVDKIKGAQQASRG